MTFRNPSGPNHFPLSRRLVIQNEYDPAKNNPLQFLTPGEQRAAELFALVERDPAHVATLPPKLNVTGYRKKWDVLRCGTFHQRFRQEFGFDLMPKHRKGLEENPAWRHYVLQLREQTRDAVMGKLKQDSLDAYEDFIWSRKAAKEKGDYKEARLAAADHLDRVGATEKPQPFQPNMVVILKGRTYGEGELLKELPATTAEEIIVEAEDGT